LFDFFEHIRGVLLRFVELSRFGLGIRYTSFKVAVALVAKGVKKLLLGVDCALSYSIVVRWFKLYFNSCLPPYHARLWWSDTNDAHGHI